MCMYDMCGGQFLCQLHLPVLASVPLARSPCADNSILLALPTRPLPPLILHLSQHGVRSITLVAAFWTAV